MLKSIPNINEIKPYYIIADGQAIAIKLSKQINRVTDLLKKCMQNYNSLGGQPITFENVKDPCGPLYSASSPAALLPTADPVPQSIKKQLIDLFCLQERCKEEVELLKKEMIQLMSYIFRESELIERHTQSCSHSGIKAVLRLKQLRLKKTGYEFQELWKNLKVSPYCLNSVTTWVSCSNLPQVSFPSDSSDCDSDISDDDDF